LQNSVYALDSIAWFNTNGLWSVGDVWFSRHGTLLSTAEHFVIQSPQGLFAHELGETLHVEVQDSLDQLVQTGHLRKIDTRGLNLYTAADSPTHRLQLASRHSALSVPLAVNAGAPHSLPRRTSGCDCLVLRPAG
jgi:hypothetical protein